MTEKLALYTARFNPTNERLLDGRYVHTVSMVKRVSLQATDPIEAIKEAKRMGYYSPIVGHG